MPSMRSIERNESRSVVSRTVALLNAFGPDDDELGITELARRSGLAKATAWRIASELVEAGFLERHARGLRLGVRLFELGELATRPRDRRRAAAPHMIDLNRATGHTVHLAVLDGSDVVYLHIVRGQRGPALPSRVGGRMPAHATGLGKALLAALPPEQLDAVVARGLAPMGPRTITDPVTLLGELDRVRSTGVAYEREESAAHVGCAASTVETVEGTVAAISVSGWSGRLDVRRVGPAVRMAALAVGRQLEGRRRVDRA